jgi:hypothetical protein
MLTYLLGNGVLKRRTHVLQLQFVPESIAWRFLRMQMEERPPDMEGS